MSTPIYLLGKTPLVILGLEKTLSETSYNYQQSFLLGKDKFDPECAQRFVLFLQLKGELSGHLTLVKKLVKNYPTIQLMILHDSTKVKQVKVCFHLGVKAYLLSSICVAGIHQAVRTVLEGQTYLDPRLGQLWASKSIGVTKEACELTRREKEVLHLIVDEFTTKEIAERLFISPCTAETHRMNIIHKLGVRNTAGLVREAVMMGW